jgi:hypothetical protein
MWSSYIPVLVPLVQKTTGPVLELGCGFYSTPLLHWLCHEQGRPLFTYEGNEEWYEQLASFHRRNHYVRYVDDWDSIDLSDDWGCALVDHAPAERRYLDVLRLAHAGFVVAHDAGNTAADYGYDKIGDEFKYKYRYVNSYPRTAILSNVHDPTLFLNPKQLKPGV